MELANLRFERFKLWHDERDFDASALQFTHAIFLPFHHLTKLRHDATVTAIFLNLSQFLIHRSRKSQQPGDVRYSVKYLRYLRDRPLQAEVFRLISTTHNEVTAILVDALALQAELENGDVVDSIEEMLVLCRELLSSNASKQDLNAAVETFAETIIHHTEDTLDPPSQQVIECLREANTRLLSDSYSVSLALSTAFSARFAETSSNGDYECAMGHLDKFIVSHFPIGGPRQTLRRHLSVAANLATRRSNFSRDPEYLEEAINRTRAHLGFVSVEDLEHDEIAQTLAHLVGRRGLEFGDVRVLHSDDPVVEDLPSFSQLAASLAKSKNLNFKPPPMTTKACSRHHRALVSAGRITDQTEIEKAVQYCRLLLPFLRRSSNRLTHPTLLLAADLLKHAFDLTHNPEYLYESIDIYRSILERSYPQWIHFRVILKLFLALLTRLDLSRDRNDLEQMIQLFPIISNCTYEKAHERFTVIAALAFCSRDFRHPRTSAIYHGALSLMKNILVFAPTLKLQHGRLIQNEFYEKLPLDYASYEVQQSQLKEASYEIQQTQLKKAIEVLEQGRGLVWSEMRGFRTSINRLWVVNSHLAKEFASANRKLEELTTSTSPGVMKDAMGVGDDEEMGIFDEFDRVLAEHRKLLDQRNGLVAQIRALAGFENFLMASSFDTLRSAAACGPVIIINHSMWRSDIIILLYNSPPSLVPTTDNFYDRAKGLREQLLAARKKGLDSMEYDDTLISVLEALHDLVGRRVIQRLQELNVPEQSRIWWCPTSVFCSLPLHAMGPIRSKGSLKLYFSDLYIPSYTPTLSALIEARKPGVHLSEKPSILLVAQPDKSMPRACDEISLIRHLPTKVKTLTSKNATSSAVIQGLQDHRFAHFVCHGILETGKPFDASFKLYQGKRLTLLKIIRSQLPSAEFAFLSACHTAELTEKSVSGEGLHLTAAVQFAGFRSVVGTMWAMADIDGHDLAKHFYASVFSERWKGVPYHERTAEALRDAVRVLRRKKKMTTERWVNFVHFGA